MTTACWIMAICLATGSHPVTITLRSSAHVEGPTVRIGHIADVETVDQMLADELMALPLGDAPEFGSTAGWKFGDIRTRLKRAGVRTKSVRLIGPEVVWVIAVDPNAPPNHELVATGKQFHAGIFGVGYFKVQDDDGNIYYTRNGNWAKNADNQFIVASSIGPLEVQQTITVPIDAINIGISADGQVSVTQPNQVQPQIIGQIQAIRFRKPDGLKAVGSDVYVETVESGPPEVGNFNSVGWGHLMQGFLERTSPEPVEVVSTGIAER